MALSFRGGLFLENRKLSARESIENMQAPALVTIPLLQHKGEACESLVKVGDRVLKGQKIAAQPDGDTPLHASVSGKVSAIAPVSTTLGETLAIIIENDFKDELSPEVVPFSVPISKAEPEELIRHIREKGIVGMGGKGFPTWRKIEAARGKAIRVIINGAESEPYLTVDHRLLLEKTEEVVGGVKILMRAIGCDKAVFAIEDNKEDAVEAVQKVIGASPNFDVAVFRTKYPQGDEKYLVRALMGKEVKTGTLPIDLGGVTFNVETCWSIYRAFVTGMPVVDRLLTVSGDCMKLPSNLLVPLGVSFSQVIHRCGGVSPAPDRILSGGPMMGEAIEDDSMPITKCVSAVLAIRFPEYEENPCIRCGRCMRSCPMRLMPQALVDAVKKKDEAKARDYSLSLCTECGLCTYVCPARISLLEWIRQGKAAFYQKERSE